MHFDVLKKQVGEFKNSEEGRRVNYSFLSNAVLRQGGESSGGIERYRR